MNHLLSILKSVLPSAESAITRDEAYVAAAVDLHDVERRLREIDGRGRDNWSPIVYGLYTR